MSSKEITIKFILRVVKTRKFIFLTLLASIICFFVAIGLVVIFTDIYGMLIILFLNIIIGITVIMANYRESLSIGYRIPEEIGPSYITFKNEMKFLPGPKKITTNKLINSLKDGKENKEDLI